MRGLQILSTLWTETQIWSAARRKDNQIAKKGKKKVNDITVVILYRDGEKEVCHVADYKIESGCLSLHQRYKETRYIPLDLIKEWKVFD